MITRGLLKRSRRGSRIPSSGDDMPRVVPSLAPLGATSTEALKGAGSASRRGGDGPFHHKAMTSPQTI